MSEISSTLPKLPHPGPFLAEITSHMDSARMGGLMVKILTGTGGYTGKSYPVQYLPPFFGTTPYEATTANVRSADSAQSSYGFWMVPPDVGTEVIVMFIEGDPNQGYWMGCVPPFGQNSMVPGIASSTLTELTPQEEQKLGTNDVPVKEYNKRLKRQHAVNTDKEKRTMHPFALRLAEQGLLKDPIRGTTTSSARRDLPSAVYGISTPGPPVLDKTYTMGTEKKPFKVHQVREGGTQFVMDDGHVGKDEKSGKKGILDELVRIRTRTGHQILLHNSSDLIYIANAKGTAWLEFTSDGKIDIFAADSVSIHTENDFNFRADRDINLECGRNINMASQNVIHMEAGGWIEGISAHEVNFTAKNHINMNATGRFRVTTYPDPLFPVNSGIDFYAPAGNISMTSFLETKIQAATMISLKSTLGNSIVSLAGTQITSVGGCLIKSGGTNIIEAEGANVFNASGLHIERASIIDMNGPTPAPSGSVISAALTTALSAIKPLPESATSVSSLIRYELPYREADKNATATMQKGWENNQYYRQLNISSIMRRVPTHEPWDHHENIDPAAFKPAKTDRGG